MKLLLIPRVVRRQAAINRQLELKLKYTNSEGFKTITFPLTCGNDMFIYVDITLLVNVIANIGVKFQSTGVLSVNMICFGLH